MGEQKTDAERWWPHLSIDAKHDILADPAAPLSERGRQASTRLARRLDRMGPIRADGSHATGEVRRDGTDPPVIWLTR